MCISGKWLCAFVDPKNMGAPEFLQLDIYFRSSPSLWEENQTSHNKNWNRRTQCCFRSICVTMLFQELFQYEMFIISLVWPAKELNITGLSEWWEGRVPFYASLHLLVIKQVCRWDSGAFTKSGICGLQIILINSCCHLS